ncbi:MAG: uracil-DNA glycosylase family protein [bacterium]|jgi:DNA polymerase|nr:uracil-DNA glycosylase [Betaproteobacteria bacterium]
MSRRSDILDEMGLSPRWRLRDGAAQLVQGVPVAAVAPAVAAPASAPPAAPVAPTVATAPTLPRDAAIMQMDWPQLEQAVAGCTACPLAGTRNCTVFGVGDRRASWLFVGEGPGAEEDERGEPFVGQAGRLLDNMLAALGMRRGDDVYVANIVKCRPPGNRVPAAAEVAACETYLHRQIQLLQPKVIVALGKTAAVTLLGKEQSIASMRGKVFRYRDTPLMVTYHPAYLLRTLPDKIKAWEDLCFIRDKVDAWRDGAGAEAGDVPAP